MSFIYDPSTKEHKEVTNLGWLLRHADEVTQFDVTTGDTRYYQGWEIPDPPREHSDSLMIARMEDGRLYITRWASHTVMLDWLHRPRFIGKPIRWFGWSMVIGQTKLDTLRS